ncbi:MAG: DUF2207 domain-containing protein [Leucobacter sp.]
MQRLLRTLIVAVAVAFATVAAGSAFASTAAPARADVNDFGYESWHAEYTIDTDESGRATARVTETLVARFPDFDQNRGIVRGIPIDYEGASTDPRDFSVTDENGAPVSFWTEREGGFVAVLTGDDDYVHGSQTYVISYTLSDVILARDDGAADEFYWDIAPIERAQPISAFSADILFRGAAGQHLDGNARCYRGGANSRAECEITTSDSADERTRLSVGPVSLAAGEGVTVAIGLEPGTFAQPEHRLPNFALDALPLGIAVAGVALGVSGTISTAVLRRKRRSARGIVVPQYDVPATVPPLLAGPIFGSVKDEVSAEVVHLAVIGAIRIEDGKPGKGLFGPKKGRPVLRLLDPALAADPLDQKALRAIFGKKLEPGTSKKIPQNSEKFADRMRALREKGKDQALKRGYFTRERSRGGFILGLVSLGIAALLIVFAVVGFVVRGPLTPVLCVVAAAVTGVLGLISLSKHRVHTPLGAEWREYLEGVRLFIGVAEADRVRMLQSYEGAERRSDGTVDVIHLYEQLLPYAMLFGMEKSWSQVLRVRYEERPGYVPVWYPGVAAHGIASLPSTISRFTSSFSSSASYTSSSSGGSSSGGFSGGGGGGGFSGGR